ncbi:MAG: hypothetical protein ACI8SJ_001230 [Shewanella sp.]|jgi:hypothetical protein
MLAGVQLTGSAQKALFNKQSRYDRHTLEYGSESLLLNGCF